MMGLSGQVYYTWDDVKDICSLDLQTHQATSFREAQYPCLVVLLLINAALSLASMSFLSLLQNMSSSSPPRSLNMFGHPYSGSLLMVYLRAPEIHWRLLKSVHRWLTLLSLLRALNLNLMSPSWMAEDVTIWPKFTPDLWLWWRYRRMLGATTRVHRPCR